MKTRKKKKKARGGARPGAGRPPRDYGVTQKTLMIPDDVMALYRARIEATGRNLSAEMLVAIRRHVGLE